MAIKDRFRRALRKSESSGSLSQSDTGTAVTTATTNTSQSSLSAVQTALTHTTTTTNSSSKAPALKLTKTFTWGHREKDPEKEKAKEERRVARKKRAGRPLHPSEKPLTAQNLKHQEMLSHFTMTFGATHNEHLGAPSIGGVSPCCTRPASIVDVEDYETGP